MTTSRCLSIILSTLVLVSLSDSMVNAQKGESPRRPANPALAPIKDDPNLPRVLLIGDSISIGYTVPTRELLKGVANVHRAQENCGHTAKGLDSLDEWLGKKSWDVIHFNWGLHDLKYINGEQPVSLAQYRKNLETLVRRLEKTGATLIWCSTTPVPEGVTPPRDDQDVQRYNAAALEIMRAHDIAVDDLYSFAKPKLDEIQLPQNVHFGADGSKVLAQQVARTIRRALNDR